MVECLKRKELRMEQKSKKKGKEKKKPNRKAVKITFVVPPCKDCDLLRICKKGQRTLARMMEILKAYKLDEYEEVSMYDKNLSKSLREQGIPELWMHDFEDEAIPIWPHKMYYIVEFNDGVVRLFTWIQDSDDTDYGGNPTTANRRGAIFDPMYQ